MGTTGFGVIPPAVSEGVDRDWVHWRHHDPPLPERRRSRHGPGDRPAPGRPNESDPHKPDPPEEPHHFEITL
jgi:hypothetical protein